LLAFIVLEEGFFAETQSLETNLPTRS